MVWKQTMNTKFKIGTSFHHSGAKVIIFGAQSCFMSEAKLSSKIQLYP